MHGWPDQLIAPVRLLRPRNAIVIYLRSCPEDACLAGSPPDGKGHRGSYGHERGAFLCCEIRQVIC